MGIPAMAFNPLRFANRLKAAGILSEHAEAEAEAIAEVFEVNFKELVTKETLNYVVSDLSKNIDTRFESLHKDIDARFEASQKDMDTRFESFRKDIDARFEAIDAQFIQLEQRVDAKVGQVKIELIKWMIGLVLAQFGLLSGLVISMFKFLPKMGI